MQNQFVREKSIKLLQGRLIPYSKSCLVQSTSNPSPERKVKAHEEDRSPARGYVRFLLLLVLSALLIACATVPHTGRRQFNLVSDSQLNSLASQAFSDLSKKTPESKDDRLKEIAERVVDRISKAAESLDKPGFSWKVRVVDDPTPNAFCLPGGKIVVFTGMASYAVNEAGLAAVIGHETAHAVARHGAERLSQEVTLKGALTLGGEILKRSSEDGQLDQKGKMALAALGLGAMVGVVLPYSREHEREADQIGQTYMAAAGYDPAESVVLWKRMSQIKKPPIPVWLSTHPSDQDRVENLEALLPKAVEVYKKSPRRHGQGVKL
ncbi:MAG: M48 family metallopeptidase [Pseudomonadota bacterium]